MVCDYCCNQDVCKVRIHNHFWFLCLDCATKNRERLGLTDEFLNKIKKELEEQKTKGNFAEFRIK